MDEPRSGNAPLDLDGLLAQGRWVRRLAARLVGDASAAEDVVQETWLAALQSAPRGGGPTRLKAWLAAVTRNLALKRLRDEGARREREAATASARSRTTGAGDPSGELERLQLQHALVEAVLALDDPYRSTLVARYLDEREVREIARQHGVSPAAVRQRLSRGLAMLRARLESEGGANGMGALAFLPLLQPLHPPLGALPAASAPLVSASLAGASMASKSSLAATVAVGAAALLSAGVYFFARPDARVSGDGVTTAQVVPVPLAVEPTTPPAARDPARTLEPHGIDEPAATRFEAAIRFEAATPAVALEGRVVDLAGRPVIGARVECALVAGDLLALLTGADGGFRIRTQSVPGARRLPLVVEADGFVPSPHDVGLPAGEVLTVVLRRWPVVTARVLDPEGRPPTSRGEAWLRVAPAPSGEAREFVSELDGIGQVTFVDVVPGRVLSLGARVVGFPEGERELEGELELDTRHELELSLEAGALVRGVVVDQVTREPLPGAEVWADSWSHDPDGYHPMDTADSLGRFELSGVAPERHLLDDGRALALVRLFARGEGYTESPLRAYAAPWVDGGPFEFEVELTRGGCRVEGRVLEPDGATPSPRALVHVIDAEGKHEITFSDEDGRFRFDERPVGACWVLARQGEFRDDDGGRNASAVLELAPGTATPARLVLQAGGSAAVQGRVLDPAGAPVPGTTVEARFLMQSGNLSVGIDSRTQRTDARGHYRIERLYPGRYNIRTSDVQDCVTPRRHGIDLEADEERRELDFVVAPCLRVAGQVSAGEHEPENLRVALFDATGERVSGHADVGADGTFEVEPLVRGVYELRVLLGEQVLETRSVGPLDDPHLRLGR